MHLGKRIGVALALVAALALTVPVLAGGWAEVKLDAPLNDIHAGETYQIGFTALQHGKTANPSIKPVLRAELLGSDERLEIAAQPQGAAGHFVVEVVFPREGTWNWQIHPEPFGPTEFEPLNVQAPIRANTSTSVFQSQTWTTPVALGGAALLILLGAALILGRRQQPAAPKQG
jgi:hypothetical protein